MRNPLVSVLTPTYNHSAYIQKCIESVLCQTYTNWEMIIIDDGSTDDTVMIAENYTDPRIQVYRQEHKGIFEIGETYNKALEYSKGELIAILEGDDWWNTEKLTYQVDQLTDKELVLSYGMVNVVCGQQWIKTVPESNQYGREIYNNDPVGNILKILLFSPFIPAVTLVIRKTVLLSIGGFKQGFISVDTNTILELSLIGKFGFVGFPIAYYRNYGTSVTKTYTILSQKAYYASVLKFIKTHNLDVDITKVHLHHRKKIAIAHTRQGRYELAKGNFTKAWDYFGGSLRLLKPTQMKYIAISVIGLLLCLIRTDFEWIAKITKRINY